MDRNKEQRTNAGMEQFASIIAENIVNLQSRIAVALNKRFNRISKSRQLGLLAIGCTLIAGALISSALCPYGKTAMSSSTKNYLPTHIGVPSEMPRPTKPIDSLTTKK